MTSLASRAASALAWAQAWLSSPGAITVPSRLPFVGGARVATLAPATLLSLLGGAWLVGSVLPPLLSLLAGALGLRRAPRWYGRWAVVTGGSEGIGLAYATELARKGMSVAILARDAAKLAAARESIREAVPGAEVLTASVDFAARDCAERARAALFSAIAPDDVGILVNCVGVSYPAALYFDPRELDKDAPGLRERIVAVNVAATTEMVALVLPAMLVRGRGAIINIGSGYGRLPSGAPLYAEYCASKAYVDFLSRSLHHEVASKGVLVQCQSPFMVATALSGIRRPTLLAPSARTYARAAVADIGSGASTVPYWPHGLLDWLFRSLPEPLVAAYFTAHHVDLRERYARKQKRLADERARLGPGSAGNAVPQAAAGKAPNGAAAAAAASGGGGGGGGGKRASSRSRKAQ